MEGVQGEIPGLVIHTVWQPEGQPSSIQAQFETFHQLNPWVLRALETLTADYLKRGARARRHRDALRGPALALRHGD